MSRIKNAHSWAFLVAFVGIPCTLWPIMHTTLTSEELRAIKVEKLERSTVKIEGEIPFAYVEKHRNAALKHIGKDIQIDGFRKGHIPETVLVGRVGEMAVLSEMAERALYAAYPDIVKTHELAVLGYPKIQITKLASGNPLGFLLTVAVVPELSLPDYKKIAADINKNKESLEVTDTEVDAQITDILRQKVAYERLQSKAKKNGGTEPHVHDAHCNHDHEDENTEAPEDTKDLPIPELTDAYVKTLGQPGQFETVADFKAKIKEHLAAEKERDVLSRHRAKITDAIIEKTGIELPQVLIDSEIGQMFAQMEEDLGRAQLKMDDYLKHIKKTKEDLKSDWTPAAEKRAKLQLILNEIATKENVAADAGRVDHEVSQLLAQYKDADENRVRIYVESVIRNEETLKMLETIM